MLKGTPRTFVGAIVLLLDGPVTDRTAQEACVEVERLPGISSCALDPDARAVVVTACRPVDRTDVEVALDRAGCRVRA